MAKRRVFVAYHHHADQGSVDRFIERFSADLEVFTDSSLERAADSDDVEYLNQVCREAIAGTSVTIVLIGRETARRKFVDWEIRDTLYRKHGLVGILRGGLADSEASVPDRLKDNINSGYSKYYRYPSDAPKLRAMIDEAYNAPASKIDNSRPKRQRNGPPL